MKGCIELAERHLRATRSQVDGTADKTTYEGSPCNRCGTTRRYQRNDTCFRCSNIAQRRINKAKK